MDNTTEKVFGWSTMSMASVIAGGSDGRPARPPVRQGRGYIRIPQVEEGEGEDALPRKARGTAEKPQAPQEEEGQEKKIKKVYLPPCKPQGDLIQYTALRGNKDKPPTKNKQGQRKDKDNEDEEEHEQGEGGQG